MTKTVIPNRINGESCVDIAVGRMIAMFHVETELEDSYMKSVITLL